MQPIRVIQLVGSFQIGGGERVALTLAARLGPPRFRSELWCVGSDGPLRDMAEREGVRCRILGGGVRPLARELREARADVVHCHSKRAHFRGALAAALSGGAACVHTRHGLGERDVSWRVRLLEHMAMPLTRAYVAVSDEVLKRTARYRRIPFRKAVVIANGVDTDLFHPAGEPISNSTVRAVCVARLSEEKRHCDLLDATARVRKMGVPLSLLLVGDGPLRAELEAQAQRLGIADAVSFLGNRSDVPELLRGCDLFVLSSRVEGLPLSVLEAMSSGLPVVATAVGALPAVVQPGSTGLLVPPLSPARLAEALAQVCRDAEFRRQARQIARRLVVEQFSVTRMIDAHERLYARLK